MKWTSSTNTPLDKILPTQVDWETMEPRTGPKPVIVLEAALFPFVQPWLRQRDIIKKPIMLSIQVVGDKCHHNQIIHSSLQLMYMKIAIEWLKMIPIWVWLKLILATWKVIAENKENQENQEDIEWFFYSLIRSYIKLFN